MAEFRFNMTAALQNGGYSNHTDLERQDLDCLQFILPCGNDESHKFYTAKRIFTQWHIFHIDYHTDLWHSVNSRGRKKRRRKKRRYIPLMRSEFRWAAMTRKIKMKARKSIF